MPQRYLQSSAPTGGNRLDLGIGRGGRRPSRARRTGAPPLRLSDLERAIPGVSQKMLAQQLRQLERDGMVRRIVHAQVPPKVEYALTPWGQALCPALDALLTWRETRTDAP